MKKPASHRTRNRGVRRPPARVGVALLFATAAVANVPAVGAGIADIYAEALSNDPTLARERASTAVVKEGVAQARARFLPQVSASAGRSQGRSVREASVTDFGGQRVETPSRTTDTERTNWGASVNQDVLNLPSWFQYRSAKEAARRADWDLQAAEQNLIIRVAETYLGVLRSQAALESATAAEEAVQRQLEQVQQRFDVGLVAITDVLESKAEYDNSVVLRIQAHGTRDNSLVWST